VIPSEESRSPKRETQISEADQLRMGHDFFAYLSVIRRDVASVAWRLRNASGQSPTVRRTSWTRKSVILTFDRSN
jgi:hypothetical protein